MHFCRLNLEFLGLGYKPCKNNYNYGFKTFELYRCKKCGKLIFKNEEKHGYIFDNVYNEALDYTKKCGYRPLGELIDNKGTVKEDNGRVLTLVK